MLSELRKKERMNAGLREWYEATGSNEMFLSVITVGEIRRGIEQKRINDSIQADVLEAWMARTMHDFARHIRPVTKQIAETWGRITPHQPLPAADGLIAATALVDGLTLVTRNIVDFERSGVRILNPWK